MVIQLKNRLLLARKGEKNQKSKILKGSCTRGGIPSNSSIRVGSFFKGKKSGKKRKRRGKTSSGNFGTPKMYSATWMKLRDNNEIVWKGFARRPFFVSPGSLLNRSCNQLSKLLTSCCYVVVVFFLYDRRRVRFFILLDFFFDDEIWIILAWRLIKIW